MLIEPDFRDAAYPADPYPGTRPPRSFVHLDETGHLLYPGTDGGSGWNIGRSTGPDLDLYLADQQTAPVSDRLPVLAYGSNANPSKITWLRDTLGLRGPAVVLRAMCSDIAAVWSAGIRARDGQRPAVLARMPGVVEQHAIWLATPEQRRVLDACEGRGQRYRLAWVRADLELEDGLHLEWVLAYTARPEVNGRAVPVHLNRSPLFLNGALVRCADVEQEEARVLMGDPAMSDGLECIEVQGEP